MQSTDKRYCPVFALIIGIDQYKDKFHTPLSGAVNDARAFERFLIKTLRVPESHIKLLLDSNATRKNILDAFEDLTKNPQIRRDECTIIVFYAGHGSRLQAPGNLFAQGGWVETICPYDEDGNLVHGIPDYTVHSQLQALAAEKGRNITVILDSCHAGGATRRKPSLAPRHAPHKWTIPTNLDAELYVRPPPSAWACQRAGGDIAVGFRNPYVESHVLLASCRADQYAFEMPFDTDKGPMWRGRFSASIISVLQGAKGAAMAKMTYRDVIDLVGKWTDQTPQLEGTRKGHLLFDRRHPLEGEREWRVKKSDHEDYFEIQMGTVEGVVTNTEFRVTDAKSSELGYLIAHTVDLNHSLLKPKELYPQKTLNKMDGAQAVVSNWNNKDMVMKVFVESGELDATASAVLFPTLQQRKPDTFPRKIATFFPGRERPQQFKPDTLPRQFVRVDNKDVAHIILSNSKNRLPGPNSTHFSVERLWPVIFKEQAVNVSAVEFDLQKAQFARLPVIMNAVAHFHYFLHKHNGGNPIQHVTLEMNELIEPKEQRPELHKLPDNKKLVVRQPSSNIFDDNVATAKGGTWYGFTICNRSEHDLFPYLFYFDPAKYNIEAWYMPSPMGDTPLPASRDGREVIPLAIGYGPNTKAFRFRCSPGKVIDTAFLKVFVSTKYLDLGWIVQKSPFSEDFKVGRMQVERDTPDKVETWDAFHAVFTIKEGVPPVQGGTSENS